MWWWDDFTREYLRTHEAYLIKRVCRNHRLSEKNPVAQAQWGAWLMFVVNRRLTGD